MPLSDDARRKFNRCIEEMRRGNISSRDMAEDLLGRLKACGLEVRETPPKALGKPNA